MTQHRQQWPEPGTKVEPPPTIPFSPVEPPAFSEELRRRTPVSPQTLPRVAPERTTECHPPLLQEESEKQLGLTEAQTKEALSALLPSLSSSTPQVGGGVAPGGPHARRECLGSTSHVSLQSYTEWLQELREKGPELLRQPPASTEPSSVSSAADMPSPGPTLSLWLPPPREGRVPRVASLGSGAKPLCLTEQSPVLPPGAGLQAERG